MVTAEILAHVRPSLLDSLLTLYDASGNLIAQNDDAKGQDSLLNFKLPADGTYYLALTDANNRGGAAFGYLMRVGVK
jgi:hypothetical protein